MIARIAVLLFALSASGAEAHDYWSDGKPVPDWVKASCCGPADAHHLRPDQVHRISDEFYSVDGYVRRIPVGQALPSLDGDYWIFYRDDGGGSQSGVYCFFVPMDSDFRRPFSMTLIRRRPSFGAGRRFGKRSDRAGAPAAVGNDKVSL